MEFSADLHIHSCLSPCGDLSLSPRRIAEKAVSIGLSLVALTDHNTALNCPAFEVACRREHIEAVFGIEVTTAEEIHVLALFETVEQALRLGELLYEALPPVRHDPERQGDQVYVNDAEEILGEVDKYLIAGVSFSLEETCNIIYELEGLFIPAHIERPSFSLLSQLGILPEMDYSALEITQWPCSIHTGTVPLISNSDAHMIELIGSRFTLFRGENPSFRSFRKALQEMKVCTCFQRY